MSSLIAFRPVRDDDREFLFRLYSSTREGEIRIVDIALLPERRGASTGAKIIRRFLTEAGTAGKPVRLHVQHGNRAISLYQRLGFEKAGDTGVYQLMQWTPPP